MKILVVAAHPDDEVLGCGGYLYTRILSGDSARILILGEGITSRLEKRVVTDEVARDLEALKKNAAACAAKLGAGELFFKDLPDNRFDSIDFLDIVKMVEKHIREFKPDVVFTHFSGDLNIDHRISYNAVMTAARPHSSAFVPEIYSFEVPSSTDLIPPSGFAAYQPNFYFALTQEALEAKLAAYSNYVSEVPAFPHSRSIESLKIHHAKRGIECGALRAESFIQIRRVVS